MAPRKTTNKAIKFVPAAKKRGFHRTAYALLRQPFMAALGIIVRSALFLLIAFILQGCGRTIEGCEDPHSSECIFRLYYDALPKDYTGNLSILAVEKDGLSNDASRFVSNLNDCQLEACWFSVDASESRYFIDVMYEARHLENILLLGKVDKVNMILIVRGSDRIAYEQVAAELGISAKTIVHPSFSLDRKEQ